MTLLAAAGSGGILGALTAPSTLAIGTLIAVFAFLNWYEKGRWD